MAAGYSEETSETAEGGDLASLVAGLDDLVRQGLMEILEGLKRQEESARETIDGLRAQVARLADEAATLAPVLPPQAISVASAAPIPVGRPVSVGPVSVGPVSAVDFLPSGAGDGGWESILFGRDLAEDASLAGERQTLLNGLRQDDHAAQSLVGQLLAFRAAHDERRVQLLKEVGEAYYAWCPSSAHGHDPFRDSLIRWLTAQCQAIGLGNKIELVRPGDRFDSKRHNAKNKGIEVADVNGWVVLRDNGSVYTKANVALR